MPLKKAQYNALDVAQYIIYLASQNIVDEVKGEKVYEGITNLKLQKLLYFVQVYFLVKQNKPLFSQEFKAWQYGPVVEEVYQEYKRYGRRPIVQEVYKGAHIETQDATLIKDVWEFFGKYSVGKLVNMTHQDAPWQDAMLQDNKVIPKSHLQEYYKPLFR